MGDLKRFEGDPKGFSSFDSAKRIKVLAKEASSYVSQRELGTERPSRFWRPVFKGELEGLASKLREAMTDDAGKEAVKAGQNALDRIKAVIEVNKGSPPEPMPRDWFREPDKYKVKK